MTIKEMHENVSNREPVDTIINIAKLLIWDNKHLLKHYSIEEFADAVYNELRVNSCGTLRYNAQDIRRSLIYLRETDGFGDDSLRKLILERILEDAEESILSK